MSSFITEPAELEEALVEVRKRKRKRKLIGTLFVALLFLIILGLIWLYGYNYAKNSANTQIEELHDRISELETTPIAVDPITPELVLSVISSNTAEISELASAEYVFTNAAKFTDTKQIMNILDWMTEKSFVQKWDGTIKAGIKLDEVSVTVVDQVITVTMPPAQILSYEVDYDSVEILDERNNIFNPITVEDRNGFDIETSEEMKQRAIDHGLLEKAQKNAERIIAALLATTLENMQDYTVEFVYTDSEA